MAGAKGRLIAPAIVELLDPGMRATLEKKLRARGIFLDSKSALQPVRRRARR